MQTYHTLEIIYHAASWVVNKNKGYKNRVKKVNLSILK